jgi:HEAT repeat protein
MLVVIQEQVHEILVRQGRHATRIVSPTVNDNRWEQAIERAIQHLSSQDELMVHNIVTILQEIGSPAVPPLLSQLKSANETVQLAIVDILHTVRDMQSLPVLLTLLGDTSPAIQQRVAQTLRHFAPESIASLIDLVLHGPDDTVADRTAQILISIGESVVGSIIEVLSNVVPGRTRFLVQVLALIRDPRAVPALVSLLEQPQLEPLLVIAIIRALCQFPDKRVVTPLLSVLTNTNPQLYEEAITALSQLGEIALPGLIAELDVENETVVIPRVRRAILGISPFAGTMLIDALEHGSQGQSMQIMQVFKARGRDGAQMLVQHLLHQDERVRTLIHETLQQMPGTITVPALMSVLGRAELNDVVSTFLLRYPDAAIDPLVALLGEDERGSLVAELLPQFGAAALRPLLVGLDDSRDIARERARKAIVKLIRQKRGKDQRPLLQEALQLFHPQPVQRVREALLQIWSTDLANIGVPTLLDGLEDAYLIEDVAEIFVRLCRKPAQQEAILDQLIASLSNEKLRLGAEIALIRIGAPSVGRIGELIVHEDSGLEKAARYILGEIGVPALSFIWTAYSDRNNAERREAARAVFHSMPPEMIKDELVALLVSDNRDDISMAMSLLIERIHEEMSQLNYVDQVMVPELIKYVQTYQVEETNLRIIALLLLLGEQTIVDHLLQALTEHPSSQRQLLYAFLLMSSQTQQGLLNVFSNPSTPAALRVDIATILSMTITPAVMVDYARNISMYGLSGTTAATRKEYFSSDQLAISLRALGGLLASGQWDAQTLHQLLDMTAEDDPAREVFNILLGWRYEPQIAKLKYDLEAQRDTLMKEMTVLVASVNDKQSTINRLEAELEKFHDEHDLDEEELKLVTHEKDTLHASVEKLMRENKDLRLKLEQTTRMRDKLASQYQALMRQQGGAGDMPGSSSPSNQATPSRPSQVPRSR